MKKIKPHVSTPADILDRRGYVERIHEAVLGQAGIATHDVLIHHDAALRAQAKTRAEERLLKAKLRADTLEIGSGKWRTAVWQMDRAARAVRRERERGKQ